DFVGKSRGATNKQGDHSLQIAGTGGRGRSFRTLHLSKNVGERARRICRIWRPSPNKSLTISKMFFWGEKPPGAVGWRACAGLLGPVEGSVGRLTGDGQMSMKIVVPDDFPVVLTGSSAERRLRTLGNVTVYVERGAEQETELVRRIGSADIVVSLRAYTRFSES